jgi:hypothetical protein
VEPSITNLTTNDIVPVVRAALRELTELRGAVQLLGERVEALTAELSARFEAAVDDSRRRGS